MAKADKEKNLLTDQEPAARYDTGKPDDLEKTVEKMAKVSSHSTHGKRKR